MADYSGPVSTASQLPEELREEEMMFDLALLVLFC